LTRFIRRLAMRRIPDQELERLKQEVSLVRLVESQGYVRLIKRDYMHRIK
jgi:hypothetical protein